MANKNQSKKKQGVNSMTAGITGAIIGGVAAATAMVLSDEKKRKQIQNTLANAKDKATGYVEDLRDKKDEVQEKLVDGTEKAKKTADILKKSTERTAKDIKKTI